MAAFFARIPRSGESQCNFIGCSHDSQTRLRPLLFNLGTSILQHTHTHALISPDLRAPYIRQAKQYCFFLPLLSSSFLFLSRSGLFYFLPHALPLTPNKPIMLITTGVWKGSRAPPKRTRISWAYYPPVTPGTPFILVYSNAFSAAAGLVCLFFHFPSAFLPSIYPSFCWSVPIHQYE